MKRRCNDCGGVMFKRGVDTEMNQIMEGWACTKCNLTIWEKMKNDID